MTIGQLSYKQAKHAFDKLYVSDLLDTCDGNVSKAARIAGKDRSDFYQLIQRSGVDLKAFRQPHGSARSASK